MTASPYLQRVEARRWLLTAVRSRAPEGVDVLHRLPPSWHGRRIISAGDVEGEVSVRTLRPGRVSRTDEFDLEVYCLAGPGSTPLDRSDSLDPYGYASVEAAVADQMQAVDDAVADDPRLGANGGATATLGTVRGPDSSSDGGQGGPEAAGIVVVHFSIHHR